MKKRIVFFVVIVFVGTIASGYWYLYNRWNPLWVLEEPKEVYPVLHYQDDTLRVLMIGDSWVGMRTDSQDDLFQSRMSGQIDRPVIMNAQGKGGEKTRGIYKLMFERGESGTKPLLSLKPDYCVISAGINDAAANLGTKQYCYYFRRILDFLLANGICPVVLEVPNVNLWHLYGEKPLKDLAVDFLRSTMTGCKMYQFGGYRDALYQMLVNEGLMDKVVYVSMKGWNDASPDINSNLFMSDQIHLNRKGYEKLDSCIAIAIAKDLENSSNPSFVY